MSVLIFRLNDVSEEEAEDVRQLLAENGCGFYESSAGRWGVSVAGLWLQDESQKDQARALIDEYQQQRMARIRAAGEPEESTWGRFKRAPLAFVAMMLLVVVVVYISVAPFIGLL